MSLVLVVLGYLAFVLFDVAKRPAPDVCNRVEVKIMDSTRAGFITRDEVLRLLEKEKVALVGSPMQRISSENVQKILLKNSFISQAICYKNPDGCFNIMVQQRLPIMRVMTNNNEDYYLDADGKPMKPMGYSADLIVATGNISRAFAKDTLLQLGLFLRDNAFWNDQIEQADVKSDGSVDLVTRVGSSVVHLGPVDELDLKFRNLRAFYDKVLPTVGWNKYSNINIEHTNQIICKKNKKENNKES